MKLYQIWDVNINFVYKMTVYAYFRKAIFLCQKR